MRAPDRPLLAQLAWHALAILILACLPLLQFEAPLRELHRHELLPLAVLLGAYATSVASVMSFVGAEGRRAAGQALLITLGNFGLWLVILALVKFDLPRYLLLPIFLAAAVLVPLSVSARSIRRVGSALLSVALLTVVGLSSRAVMVPTHAREKTTDSLVKTAFYALRLVSHEGALALPATRGGGLDRLEDRVLLGTGDGGIYLLTLASGDELRIQELPTRVPLNREEFAKALGGRTHAPKRSINYSQAGEPRVQTWRFRVADLIAQIRSAEVRIFASHHYWKAKERCVVVRVSQLTATRADLAESVGRRSWQTIYESEPCIALTGKYRMRGKNPFVGEEIGGRMALLDERTLLLTLGDHGFSGGVSLQTFAQDPRAAYGKTIRIDLDTHDSSIYTLGHRNPQGLFASNDGRIWLTEHGAQGGDELNLLHEQANYGWPLVTYGTDYGTFAWPFNEHQGRHAGYVQPAYAWVPSIGVSNLIRVEGGRFPIWRGDLLAGSLATRSLYRLALDGDRVVLEERIPVGRRIRDLLELSDGRLLLWTDDAALVTVEPASGMNAALRFSISCGGCHVVRDGRAHRIGPDLSGLLGRKVAAARGFDEYSPALRNFGGKWTRQRLDAFLRDPQRVVPGTTMAFEGLADDSERASLIAYLEALSKARRDDLSHGRDWQRDKR